MAEKNTAENKTDRHFRWLTLAEPGCMLLIAAAFGIYGLVQGDLESHMDELLSGAVLCILGTAALGFVWRRCRLQGLLDYDNAEHGGRFWAAYAAALLLAALCAFLPERTWCLMPVFVLLTLLGNFTVGILGGAVTLLLPVMLSGVSAYVYGMYLTAGMLSAALFLHPDDGKELRTIRPLALSLCGLVVCITAGSILPQNAHPAADDLVQPLANAVVSGILIFAILKGFSDRIIYRYRLMYLEWNDSENEILAARKNEDKAAYMQSVHVAYFAERIANRLGLDAEAVKCAAYYEKLLSGGSLPDRLGGKYEFPPQAREILDQYHSNGKNVRSRETCVLIAAELVVAAVLKTAGEDKPDPARVIDAVFDRIAKNGIFRSSELSFGEYEQMKKIFREEKLYYDFIR